MWSHTVALPMGSSDSQISALKVQLEEARQDIDKNRYRLAILEQKETTSSAQGPASSQPGSNPGHTDIVARVETLEALLYDLEKRLQSPPPEYSGMTTQQLAALTARIDAQPEPNDLAALSQRVSTLEQNLRTSPAAKGLLFLALGHVKEALYTGQIYEVPLRTVQSLVIKNEQTQTALETLSRHASQGISTRAVLAHQLDDLALQIARLGPAPAASSSWWDRTFEALSPIVSIHRVNDGANDRSEPSSLVRRATAAARRSELALAVEELSHLTGDAASLSQAWIQRTRARLDVERALNTLVDEAVAELTISFTQ